MRSRRQFVRLSLLALVAPAAAPPTQGQQSPQVMLPLVLGSAPAPPADMPLLGPASGGASAAASWFAKRCAAEFSAYDVGAIVAAYQRHGESVGLDWFLALAQMAHETGSLSSWWSGRPRRNPAGIGVTGETRDGLQDGSAGPAPGRDWAWDDLWKKWRAGVSFPTWADHAVPAHLGRLLAYALRDEDASDLQRQMIAYALSYRSLPSAYRGAAPTILGLNGRWAVPGTDYGQRIIALALQMRQA